MGPYLNKDLTVTGWYAAPAVLVNDEDKSCIDDEKMDWEGDGSVAEFTNTYTKTTTAPIKTDSDNNVKTGDTYAAVIIPALAVMLIAAAGAVFALRRKKNM